MRIGSCKNEQHMSEYGDSINRLHRNKIKFVLYRGSPTSTVSTSTNSTSTNFSGIGIKFVLVELLCNKFVLVEIGYTTSTNFG